MIVKVSRIPGDIPSQQGGVRGENRRDRQSQMRDARDRHTGHPLVKVRQDLPIANHTARQRMKSSAVAKPKATTSFTSPSLTVVEIPWSFHSAYLSASSEVYRAR